MANENISNGTEFLGHVLRFRDPKDPTKWITIPFSYQTMYQAYVDYCVAQTPPITPIAEKDYYIAIGTLPESIKTLEELIGSLGPGTQIVKLEAGGTGISATSVLDLLTQLGLSNNDIGTDVGKEDGFPTTAAVHKVVNDVKAQLTAGDNASKMYTDAELQKVLPTIPHITSGRYVPPDTQGEDGDIFIRYGI